MSIKMSNPGKSLIITLLLIIYALPACVQEASDTSENPLVQTVVDRVSERLVPDRREGVADLQATIIKESVIIRGETDNLLLKKQVTDSIISMGFNVIDSVQVLPSSTLNGYDKAVADLSVINMRLEPDHGAEMGSQALMGAPLKILKSDGNWILVQTADKYISWTEAGSVKMMNDTEWQEWKSASKLIYINRTGWIYKSPDSNDVISDVVAGCIMKKGGEAGAFIQVILPGGREGFVEKKFVRDFETWKNNSKPSADAILATASGLLGIPYLWGGSSVKAVDCSGFVQNTFFLNGIILSRDASLQALHGKLIDIEEGYTNLEPGDLLFFGSIRNSKPRVTHVAIYKGDSEFIHSATRVNVNSLDSARNNFSQYRKNSFLLARRILGNEGSDGITYVKDHPWY